MNSTAPSPNAISPAEKTVELFLELLMSALLVFVGFFHFRVAIKNAEWNILRTCSAVFFGLAAVVLFVRFVALAFADPFLLPFTTSSNISSIFNDWIVRSIDDDKALLANSDVLTTVFDLLHVLGVALALASVGHVIATSALNDSPKLKYTRNLMIALYALSGVAPLVIVVLPRTVYFTLSCCVFAWLGFLLFVSLALRAFNPIEFNDLLGEKWRSIRTLLWVYAIRDVATALFRLPVTISAFVDTTYQLNPFVSLYFVFMADVTPLVYTVMVFSSPVEEPPGIASDNSIFTRFDWSKVFLFSVFYSTMATLVLYSWGESRALPIAALIARLPIRALLFSPLLLLPRLTWLSGQVNDSSFGSAANLHHLPLFHRHLAWTMAFLVLVHVIGHFILICDQIALASLLLLPENLSFPWVFGWLSFIGLVVAFLSGFFYYSKKEHRDCRINFEAFWWCHIIGVAFFFGFGAIHSMLRVLGFFPYFWVPLTFFLILLLVDFFFRRKIGQAVIVSHQCTPIPNFGFELVIKTGLKCKDLSYVRLRHPGPFEMFHPFTVYSAEKEEDSDERTLRFLIQTQADDKRRLGWCRELGRYAKLNGNVLEIEGPFRSALSEAKHGGVDGVVLVAFGSGVTAILSVLNYLNKKRPNIPCVVIFSTRERAMATFVGHRLRKFRAKTPRKMGKLGDESSEDEKDLGTVGTLVHMDCCLYFTGSNADQLEASDWTEKPQSSRLNQTFLVTLMMKYADKWMVLNLPTELGRSASKRVKKAATHGLPIGPSYIDLLNHTSKPQSILSLSEKGSDLATTQSTKLALKLRGKREELMNTMFPDDTPLETEPPCCQCFPDTPSPPRPMQKLTLRKNFHVFYCGNTAGKAMTDAAVASLQQFANFSFTFHSEYF